MDRTPAVTASAEFERDSQTHDLAGASNRSRLGLPGLPLDSTIRNYFEPRFGFDFGRVRIHTDADAVAAARSENAMAYARGADLVFNEGAYNPHSVGGRELLAHELAHVVQQTGHPAGGTLSPGSAHESEANRAATAAIQGRRVPALGPVSAGTIQRVVEMRDVGRGEQSGFARLPELITRLNSISQGLTFSMDGSHLHAEARSGGHLSNFDQQMQGFIDQPALIPLRLTNRHGLLGNRAAGFHDRVLADDWSSGYVDIDDLLASSDLGLQEVLVHFIRERTATTNYAHRIGSESTDFNQPGAAGARVQAEFDRAHSQGIDAEVQVLRDFFNDPSIRLVSDGGSGDIARLYRNSRRDHIRTRVRTGRGAQAGVDAVFLDVVTRDGQVHTPEEYRAILEAERVHAQVERERLGGATEHVEGGRRVPAP